ncbi:hypothetical protein AAMO2058_001750700 [Amorphochlora amoebiformis]
MRFIYFSPSRNRESLLGEIRKEFKASATIEDEVKIAKEIERANFGLNQIRQLVQPSGVEGGWNSIQIGRTGNSR